MIEKLRNTIISAIKSGIVHIFLSSTISKIITFASGIILVRIITKEAYGVYSSANNNLGFFMLASGLGASAAVLQLCSEAKTIERREQFYHFGCFYGLSFNIVLGLIILLCAQFIKFPIEGSNYCLALMSFLPFAHLLSDLQVMYLRTELKNKEYAYASILCTVLYFVCVVSFSLVYKTTGLIIAQYVAYILSALLIVVIFRVPISLSLPHLNKQDIKDFFAISSVSLVNNGLSRLMYLLDIFVLGIVVPKDTVIAAYKVATNIPTALQFIPASIVIFIYPYFARNKDNKKWLIRNYKRITLCLGLFNAFIAVVCFVFAPHIITIVFGEQYFDAVSPFRILCVSYAISGTFRIISGNVLVTQRKLTFNLLISIFSSALNTFLNFYLIRAYSSIGAAWATFITAVVSSIISVAYLVYVFTRISDGHNRQCSNENSTV